MKNYFKACWYHYCHERKLMAVMNQPNRHGKRKFINQVTLDEAGILAGAVLIIYMLFRIHQSSTLLASDIAMALIGLACVAYFIIGLYIDQKYNNIQSKKGHSNGKARY